MIKIDWEEIDYKRLPTEDGRDCLFEKFKNSIKIGDEVEYETMGTLTSEKGLLKGIVTDLLPFCVRTNIQLVNCACRPVLISYAELFTWACEKAREEYEKNQKA